MKLRIGNAMEAPSLRTRDETNAVPVQAIGARALGALALGAIAVGALAIGAVAIGRLAIGRTRMRRVDIDELVVRKLRVTDELQVPSQPRSLRTRERPPHA